MAAATIEIETAQSTKHLQCMEIWGGNRFVESGVELPGLDAWVYSRPHGGDEGGGDVHYVSSCASGLIARVLVADVAGHGSKVAYTAERLRRLMRRHINNRDQVRLMQSLNREFAAVSVTGRFATAIAFTFRATTGNLIVSNAGHPPPLWYRARSKQWTLLMPREVGAGADDGEPRDVPFGIDDKVDYGRFEVTLDVGDTVVVYTDSLPEARSDDGRLLGYDGLLGVASRLGVAAPPNRLVRELLDSIAVGAGPGAGGAFADDVTVLAFRPNGHRRRLPLRNILMTPLRYLRGLPGTFLP